ncbi:hypothetical protein QY895_01825 [Latilactobacillus sakei]
MHPTQTTGQLLANSRHKILAVRYVGNQVWLQTTTGQVQKSPSIDSIGR